MKIYLASDHAGFKYKEALLSTLAQMGHEVVDKGAFAEDPADDYPAFIRAAAKAVANEKGTRAIVFGGSGQGEAMVANRMAGIRAAVYYGGSLDIIKLSREHNDANILSLGARFISLDEAKSAVALWLETAFSGDERHMRRIADIDSHNV
jgi:ribose 5-phosphate isomerase B